MWLQTREKLNVCFMLQYLTCSTHDWTSAHSQIHTSHLFSRQQHQPLYIASQEIEALRKPPNMHWGKRLIDKSVILCVLQHYYCVLKTMKTMWNTLCFHCLHTHYLLCVNGIRLRGMCAQLVQITSLMHLQYTLPIMRAWMGLLQWWHYDCYYQ